MDAADWRRCTSTRTQNIYVHSALCAWRQRRRCRCFSVGTCVCASSAVKGMRKHERLVLVNKRRAAHKPHSQVIDRGALNKEILSPIFNTCCSLFNTHWARCTYSHLQPLIARAVMIPLLDSLTPGSSSTTAHTHVPAGLSARSLAHTTSKHGAAQQAGQCPLFSLSFPPARCSLLAALAARTLSCAAAATK